MRSAQILGHGFIARALIGALLLCLLLPPFAAGAETKQLPTSATQIELSFAPLVEKVAPAVVNIYTSRRVRTRPFSPFSGDPFFQRFFGDSFGFGQPRERIQNSLGSGVIVASDGLIVTNYHVVMGSEAIRVVLADRREFEASFVGGDEHTDLALLRIDTGGEPLPFVELGNSDELDVGDLVLAIGNPFGVGQTVTSGIVSALARTGVGITDYGFLIQTDAAINPGNSGGALVTMDGKLAGINTAIFSRDGGSLGIGFAIPSNMVAAVIAAEDNGGRLVRPWIGAAGQPVTAELAQAMRLERPGGVIISQLYPGGPAQRSGLEVGDIVLAVNDRPVNDPEALRFRLATQPVGSTAELSILRRGKALRIPVDLVQAPEDPPRNETRLTGRHPLAGATVANLSPALAEELSLDHNWRGVIITGIEHRSIAERARFELGDIVVRINDQDVATVGELRQVLSQPASRWRITYRRKGDVRTIVVS
ncbi:DegQ family serine endoprotease [Rhodospirillaceae bacterium SYSU D60014]|uniref:DegQ family serine endoprotease n=1 Tax=Virgifigura deserti TaxID=2268457 RepID=UPI000E66310D